jgi:hypothetical protein
MRPRFGPGERRPGQELGNPARQVLAREAYSGRPGSRDHPVGAGRAAAPAAGTGRPAAARAGGV